MAKPTGKVLLLVVGVVVRALLFATLSADVRGYFTTSIETMSPVTAYPRLVEGKFLAERGMDPYASGYFKLNPLVASLVFPFVGHADGMYWFLVVVDSVTTALIMQVVEAKDILAGAMFFLFPYTIVSEFGLSAGSVDMCITAVFLWAVVKIRKLGLASLALALLVTVKPIGTLSLVFPAALHLGKPVWSVLVSTVVFWCGLQTVCYFLTGGWSSFVGSVMSPLALTDDLEPTMGMAWSMFSLVFPETVGLFRLAFHSHLLILGVPIYLRMKRQTGEVVEGRREAVLNRYLLLTTAAALLYQANPTGIDFAFIGSMLIACNGVFHDKLSRLMSGLLIVGLGFTSAIAPVWLERNTGSPNFLFHFDIVTTFVGMLAIGQGLKMLRLYGYVKKEKAETSSKSVNRSFRSSPPQAESKWSPYARNGGGESSATPVRRTKAN